LLEVSILSVDSSETSNLSRRKSCGRMSPFRMIFRNLITLGPSRPLLCSSAKACRGIPRRRTRGLVETEKRGLSQSKGSEDFRFLLARRAVRSASITLAADLSAR
jgi:hypothetical protein